MKLTNIFVICGMLFFGMSSVCAGGHKPDFGTGAFEGTITMATSGGLCGAVTFKPILSAQRTAVKLEAYRVVKDTVSDARDSNNYNWGTRIQRFPLI